MSVGGIDAGRIEAMVAQLRATAQAARPAANPVAADRVAGDKSVAQADFTSMLKSSLDQVNGLQQQANSLRRRFAMGDETVSLSDAMVSMQKAGIAFQQTIQVRNKLVSAYHEIMNMPV